MSEEKKPTVYTLTDIEQYLQGKLSPAEMHDFEKAALQDPFLADAIEGYQSSDLAAAKEDLAEIQRRLLQEEKEEAKEIMLVPRRNQWWKIAAAVIILACVGGAGWFLFNNGDQKNETAQKIDQPAKNDTVQNRQALANQINVLKEKANIAGSTPLHLQELAKKTPELSASRNSKISLTNAETEKSREEQIAYKPLIAKDTVLFPTASLQKQMSPSAVNATIMAGTLKDAIKAERQKEITNLGGVDNLTVTGNISSRDMSLAKNVTGGVLSGTLSPETLSSITSLGHLAAITVSPSITINDQALQGRVAGLQIRGYSANTKNPSLQLFKGKVIDTRTSKPIVNASISLLNNKKVVTTDKNGIFSFASADSIQKIRINSVGFEPKDMLAKASQENNIQLNEASGSLNEVVVIGYGAQRKSDVTGSVTVPAKENKIVPEGGWEAFLNYVSQKLKEQDNSSVFLHGEVEAVLTIKNRKVHDVTIVKTFNASLNKTLIRALKKGPEWSTPSNNSKEKYTVTFNL